MKAFTNPTDEQDLGFPANSGDPTFAVVHADIFIPGDCAEVAGICNHDSDDGSTAEQDCYDSGFSGGPSPEGWWGTAEESCTEAVANTDEGMFAEGAPFSSGRPKPGKSSHKSWAMYAELIATCDTGVQFVPTGDEQLCDSAGISVLAVADGGNWPDSFLDVGDVIFTPDTDCTATELCSGVDSQTTCP